MRIAPFVSETKRFFSAVLYVLGAVSVIAWVLSIVLSKHHHPFTYWAVIALGLVAASLFVWGLGRKQGEGGGVHHYHAPVTMNFGAGASGITDAPAIRTGQEALPIIEAATVNLADYIEYPNNELAVIRDKVFRKSTLRGPLLISLGDSSATWINVGFEIANNDPETMLFEVPSDSPKIGAAVSLRNVIIQDCRTHLIGMLGTREMLDDFIKRVSGP